MFRNKTILLLLALVVALTGAPLTGAQDADMVDVYGRALPEDAAPYSMQTYDVICNPTATQTNFSAMVTVYRRICLADQFSDPLVDLDNNLRLIPAAAERWEPSEDGLTWTFYLRPGQVWSDGTPLTANDYVVSYRLGATPESAYDFTWMFAGIIENYQEIVAGELPPEELGMVALDDLTLQVRTEFPFPPLPNMLVFWPPLQAAALEAHGPDYTLNPETAVSSGPFILTEFVPGERVVMEANPTYNGYRRPYLRELRGTYSSIAQFLAFQNHEIQSVGYGDLTPADFEVIRNDPVLSENYFPTPGDFRTDYLGFDTFNPPFDNVLVRQAFAHALDRESIVDNVIGREFAIPAYSMLAPGFPASDTSGELRQYQAYDCELAQNLLSEAGYPGGEGFPAVTLQLRGVNDAILARYVAAAASISECLNINIEVNNMEFGAFMDALLARPTGLQFYGVDYGMDYLDPANLLGTLWKSDGRHSWRNAEFDEIATEANSLVGDPERREQLYREAERILVEDVGAVFFYHRIQGNLFQPYLQGAFRELNDQGLPGWQWYNLWVWGTLYIDNTVVDYPTYRTQ
ncbi:MAG TPA: peptide ABC transporter substrate-binding protein [Spirillospora sp.]|nr:peptide ABC transporter substrate-binding protein [Spirillospora sp.]